MNPKKVLCPGVRGSQDRYRLISEALGQLLTVTEVFESDILAVAVPKSTKFEGLATRWKDAPLIKRFGIRFVLVGRDGSVSGL